MTPMDKLDAWESSANAMMMQGDVQEQGYAERILALIRLVRAQREVIEKKDKVLARSAMGFKMAGLALLMDQATKALALTVDTETSQAVQ